jgi:tetratricopeptide (TPR) repeat protein
MRRPARLLTLFAALSFPLRPAAAAVAEKAAVDRFGLSARSLTLGRVGAAAPDDANALVENPAALATQPLRSLHLLTASFDEGVRYYSVAYSGQGLGRWGTLGAAYMRLDYGDIPGRLTETSVPVDYAAQDEALVLGYGADVWKRGGLSAGAAVKYRRREIGDFAGNGTGADAGLLWRTKLFAAHRLAVGASYRDLLPMKVNLSDGAKREPSLKSGVSYAFPVRTRVLPAAVTLEWDAHSAPDGLAHNAGVEYDVGLVAFRAGWQDGDVTAGLGTRFSRNDNTFRVDLGMVAHEYSRTQVVSLSWLFGVAQEDAARVDRMKSWSAKKLGKEAFAKAEELEGRREYWKAKEKFEEATAWQPRRAEWSDRAVAVERKAVELDVQNAIDAYAGQGRSLKAKGRPREAFAAWQSVLALDPQNLEAVKALDDLSATLSKEEKDRAIADAQREQKEALDDMGKAVLSDLHRGDYPAALRKWERYARLSHGREDVKETTVAIRWELRGLADKNFEAATAALDAGRLKDAAQHLRVVRVVDPNRAGLEYQTNRLAESLKSKKSREGFDRKKVLDEFADAVRAFFLEKNYDKSLSIVDAVLGKDPEFEKALELREKIMRIKAAGK